MIACESRLLPSAFGSGERLEGLLYCPILKLGTDAEVGNGTVGEAGVEPETDPIEGERGVGLSVEPGNNDVVLLRLAAVFLSSAAASESEADLSASFDREFAIVGTGGAGSDPKSFVCGE